MLMLLSTYRFQVYFDQKLYVCNGKTGESLAYDGCVAAVTCLHGCRNENMMFHRAHEQDV